MKWWRCHNNSVNTGSRLPSTSDVKTRKRRNVVGIDMIRNNRIETFLAVCNKYICIYPNIFCVNCDFFIERLIFRLSAMAWDPVCFQLFSFFICGCQHHQRKTVCLYVYISDIRQIVGYRTPVFIQRFPWRLHITMTYNLPHLRLWYADVVTVIA